MLVRITNHCQMCCSHCMVEAGPDGAHMSGEIYASALEFIRKFEFQIILIGGGEPTDHPDVLGFIDQAVDAGIKPVLLSNGMFLEDKKMTDEIIARDILVQITNDDRFYPKRVPIIEHKNFAYTDRIRMLSPYGRAVTNKMETTRQSPMCFNLRSITRHLRDFKLAVLTLRGMGKMCTPSVNIDGSISAGESPSCHIIGTITDSNLKITNAVCEMKCGKCGLEAGLPPEYRKAIGAL